MGKVSDWVTEQIEIRGVRDPRVLDVMRRTPRHEFISPEQATDAYRDGPLPIGFNVTISQPFIVAYMTELLGPMPRDRVLEIGTGSGYQTAVLAQLVAEVFSVEVIEPLAAAAADRLWRHGFRTVQIRHGDGALGWPEEAPFDGIIVTAAPAELPPALVEQLQPGCRLVCPVGTNDQHLLVVEKHRDGSTQTRRILPVSFVPMVPGNR